MKVARHFSAGFGLPGGARPVVGTPAPITPYPYGKAHLGCDRGRDKGRLCPSLRTGLADLLHPALQSVVNFQEDQPTQSPALSGSSRHCLPLPGQPIDAGLETKVRVFAFALHRTESIGHLRCCFPSFFCSASPPSCLPLTPRALPRFFATTEALSPPGHSSSGPLLLTLNAVSFPGS